MQRKSRVSGEYPKTLLRFFNREEYARKFIEGHLRVRKSVDVPRKTSRRQSGRTLGWRRKQGTSLQARADETAYEALASLPLRCRIAPQCPPVRGPAAVLPSTSACRSSRSEEHTSE